VAWIRRVRTATGATAVQIAESVHGRRRIVRHVGSARDEAELGLLMDEARRLLEDDQQGLLDLGITPSVAKAVMISAPSVGLFASSRSPAASPARAVARTRVLKTSSGLLYDALAAVYASLGFDVVDDEVFRDLVIARIVEPTSLLDADRVLAELGRRSVSLSTRKRTLRRAQAGSYRDQIATSCFNHAAAYGDVSLVLYDVTTLYFEAEKEDDLRKVGYSKERRVDPQIVVGLLVDRRGFPLEIGCYEGNKAETLTIVPIVKQFQARHNLADMVVVADAGMLSSTNLKDLDDAGLRFIVGSRVTKAPKDLDSHFRWHGDAFTNGQVIDTITARHGAKTNATSNPRTKAEPVWDPAEHPGSWRAVWAYSTKRAVRDDKTLTLQENRAQQVVAGEKTARAPRFVKNTTSGHVLDEASLARARRLVGLKGYVHLHPRRPHRRQRGHRQLPRPVDRRAVLPDVQDRPARPAHLRPHPRRHRGPPDHRVHRPRRQPRDPGPQQPFATTSAPHPQAPALSHDDPTRTHPRPGSTPASTPTPTRKALSRLTQLRSST
jgi:hypothetical protein